MVTPAALARQPMVRRQTRGSREVPGRCELGRQVGGRAKVRLVRRLAREGRVRHLRVVLLDVECNQGPEALDGIQGVELEPLVLERTPERFNHRV